MAFLWTTIHVKNMEESLQFYQEIVGLKLNQSFQAGPDMEISFLGDGETKIELICEKGKDDVDIGQDISLGFEVESLEEHMAFVEEKGLKILSGPVQPNPSTKFYFIQDPNGLTVQFVQNI